MGAIPNLDLTGGAGGAATGGTVGPTTFGAINIATGVSKKTLAIIGGVFALVVLVWWIVTHKKK